RTTRSGEDGLHHPLWAVPVQREFYRPVVGRPADGPRDPTTAAMVGWRELDGAMFPDVSRDMHCCGSNGAAGWMKMASSGDIAADSRPRKGLSRR
ncbi:hypothetical protein T06_8702, partial [Trichinella sp. T6]